jgi:hypothetical protein
VTASLELGLVAMRVASKEAEPCAMGMATSLGAAASSGLRAAVMPESTSRHGVDLRQRSSVRWRRGWWGGQGGGRSGAARRWCCGLGGSSGEREAATVQSAAVEECVFV